MVRLLALGRLVEYLLRYRDDFSLFGAAILAARWSSANQKVVLHT